jgi:hypothetical protein
MNAHRPVREPVHLGQIQSPVTDPAEHDPAAGRAEIGSGEVHSR